MEHKLFRLLGVKHKNPLMLFHREIYV